MIKKRLIASLLVHLGVVVQTRRFKRTNPVGNAFTAVDFFNSWAVDEILLLEISHDRSFFNKFVDIVTGLSARCFVPLTVGGKVHTLDDVHLYTRAGADKVVVNTGAFENPSLIPAIASAYGSQCVVVSIDACPNSACPSGYEACISNGRTATGRDVLEWAKTSEQLGAGEILLNSLERDGDRRGYDLDLVQRVSEAVDIPVVAFGGVGNWDHLVEGIAVGKADAAAAGNIFHYTEHSTKKAKEHMLKAGLPMRASSFYKLESPRKPVYDPNLQNVRV